MDKQDVKLKFRKKLRPLTLTLDRAGFTPTSVSVVGLVVSCLSGWVVAQGHLFAGALVFLLGSSFDMLDGDLARLQGKVSRRGAFLDSCFDRFGEAALFAGMTWFYLTRLDEPRPVAAVLILATVVGSLTTSYVRARAEGLGETCLVGLLQRPERIVLLVLGMVLGWRLLEIVLAFLAVATLGTTAQRLLHVARKLPAADPSENPGMFAGQGGETSQTISGPAPGSDTSAEADS
jgi:CDP-diacylglycerol--glycerol-3-phosphate 3-phosphatidyltransferase